MIDHRLSHSMDGSNNGISVFLLTFFLLLRYFFQIEQSAGIYFELASLITVFFLVSAAFLPIKYLFIHFIIVAILMPDITQDDQDVIRHGELTSNTLWQLSIVGISPGIVSLALMFIYLIRLRVTFINAQVAIFSFLFVLMPFFVGIAWGGAENLARFVADLRFGVILVLSVSIGYGFLSGNKTAFDRYINVLFLAVLAVLIFDVLKLFISHNGIFGEKAFKNLSYDTAKCLVICLFFYILLEFRRFTYALKLLSPVVLFFSLYLLFEYQTRWLLITFFMGVSIFFLISGWVTKVAILVFTIAGITFLLLQDFQGTSIGYMLNRFNVALISTSNIVSIDPVRVSSMINVFYELKENFAWLTGLGAGSYITGNYFPMPELGTAAYDEVSLQEGKYYKVHDFFTNFLFKYGIIGLSGYLVILFSLILRAIKFCSYYPKYRSSLLALICTMPAIVSFAWSTNKGAMLTGVIFALYIYIDSFRGTFLHANHR